MEDKILKITKDNGTWKSKNKTPSITHTHSNKNQITEQKAVKGKDQNETRKKSGNKCEDLTTTNFYQNSNCKQVTLLLHISAIIH